MSGRNSSSGVSVSAPSGSGSSGDSSGGSSSGSKRSRVTLHPLPQPSRRQQNVQPLHPACFLQAYIGSCSTWLNTQLGAGHFSHLPPHRG